MDDAVLPVHGFVLAGGKSVRMGCDKALLQFRGRPMVEIAVEKLREFCADISIAGNRDDLARYAPVVHEQRADAGPAAGVEAGLLAATQPWVMFVPVDVPLMSAELLRRWARVVLRTDGLAASHLHYGIDHPAFCMLRRDCARGFSRALDCGERRLSKLLALAAEGSHRLHDLDQLYENEERPSIETSDRWFMNLNTREDMDGAESCKKVR